MRNNFLLIFLALALPLAWSEELNHREAPSHAAAEQIEKLIDEKCRILNKTGTSKSSALHLANWMKGQLDKQQEQARFTITRSHTTDLNLNVDDTEHTDTEQDERITYWTRQQLENRTKELNLSKENGRLTAKANFGGKRLSGVEELSMSDASHSEAVSQISQSHSTTSGSQITVRSSPVVLDKLAVCRHCHKNCQKNKQPTNASQTSYKTSAKDHNQRLPPLNADDQADDRLDKAFAPPSPTLSQREAASVAAFNLVCNSLKVQHSQSSPHRCSGKLNGSLTSRTSSVTSISSCTVTGGAEVQNPAPEACSSKYDTESDVAQLLSDETYPSENAVEDEERRAGREISKDSDIEGTNNVEEANSSTTSSATSSTSSSGTSSSHPLQAKAPSAPDSCTTGHNTNRFTGGLHSLRILDEQNEALLLNMNGHCNVEVEEEQDAEKEKEKQRKENHHNNNEPNPKLMKQEILATQIAEMQKLNETVKMSVTITESAKIVRIERSATTPIKSPRSPKPPKSPLTPKSDRSGSSSNKSKQFVPCNCKCLPEDFANTTLSPEEVELQTCKIMESPKQSPKLPKPIKDDDEKSQATKQEDLHKFCRCTCQERATQLMDHNDERDDEDMSLMLIGLAQLTPAAKLLNMKTPTAPMPTPTQTFTSLVENGFVPTISIMPATPDSVLTKTSTNVWDNSSHITTSTATANLLITNKPRQVVIENIPEDSCDESPLDEEPPYRPMSNTLRRYGTMSSLEKLPSEDHMDNEYELDDDDDVDDNDSHADDDVDIEDDDEDEELMDKARADNIELDNEIRVVTKAIYDCDDAGSSTNATSNAWSRRASNFVTGKMSFFEESRAFIDKYLGRWNQEQVDNANMGITSDPEEQMDECTSGATSGEEVWGTPTSGGDNDDMHLANSENTHSSPTKSSNSLNDDDDTELMMDELLMAPPMSASTIRGLLPRRRLEPLFEEETESDEEKTQQESEELKKGETTTNGHYLKDSEAGSSSEEEGEEEEEEEEEEEDRLNPADYDEEDEEQTSTEERLQPNLQTTILGPRPLRNPMAIGSHILPQAVLMASSCEYLLEQRLTTTTTTTTTTTATTTTTTTTTPTIISMNSASPMATPTPTPTPTPTNLNTINDLATHNIPQPILEISAAMTSTTIMSGITTTMATTTTTTTATTKLLMTATMMKMTSCSLTASITRTTQSPAVSLASIITSNESVTIRSDKDVDSSCKAAVMSHSVAEKSEAKTLSRPAKFIPPPPPPRRLLLTQTNLKTSGIHTKTQPKEPPPQRKSGDFADNCSSVAATVSADICTVSLSTHMANICVPQRTAKKTKTPRTTVTTTTKTPALDVYDTAASLAGQQHKTSNAYDSTKHPTQQQQQQQLLLHQQQQRQSSTIIETSLLSMMDRHKELNVKTHSTSSTTVSMTKMRRQEMSQHAGRAKTKMQLEMQQQVTEAQEHERNSTLICARHEEVGLALSPRQEMRLALNQDTLDDEDSISCDNGPELTTILVHDLSTFQRLTGRDLLNQSNVTRVQPKEAVISYSQQRNSKMDTPTVNRRPRPHLSSSNNNSSNNNNSNSNTYDQTQLMAPVSSMPFVGSARVAGVPQHLQPNRNTWSNSAYVDHDRGASVSDANSSDDSKLSDLEILARREKIFCMSQLRSGSQAKRAKATTTMTTTIAVVAGQTTSNDLFSNPPTRTRSTTSMADASDGHGSGGSKTDQRQRKIGRDETALMESGKANKLINFIKRRNSEVPTSVNNSQSSLNDSNSSSTPQHKQPMPMSPRKDNDKPSLNRRLWKQITKRRRSNSVSELVAS